MLTLVVAAAAAVADSKKFEWLSEDVDGGAVPAATGAPLDMALDSHHQVSHEHHESSTEHLHLRCVSVYFTRQGQYNTRA